MENFDSEGVRAARALTAYYAANSAAQITADIVAKLKNFAADGSKTNRLGAATDLIMMFGVEHEVAKKIKSFESTECAAQLSKIGELIASKGALEVCVASKEKRMLFALLLGRPFDACLKAGKTGKTSEALLADCLSDYEHSKPEQPEQELPTAEPDPKEPEPLAGDDLGALGDITELPKTGAVLTEQASPESAAVVGVNLLEEAPVHDEAMPDLVAGCEDEEDEAPAQPQVQAPAQPQDEHMPDLVDAPRPTLAARKCPRSASPVALPVAKKRNPPLCKFYKGGRKSQSALARAKAREAKLHDEEAANAQFLVIGVVQNGASDKRRPTDTRPVQPLTGRYATLPAELGSGLLKLNVRAGPNKPYENRYYDAASLFAHKPGPRRQIIYPNKSIVDAINSPGAWSAPAGSLCYIYAPDAQEIAAAVEHFGQAYNIPPRLVLTATAVTAHAPAANDSGSSDSGDSDSGNSDSGNSGESDSDQDE
jgi:hypothetical protein